METETAESERERRMAELLRRLIAANESVSWLDDLDDAVKATCAEAKELLGERGKPQPREWMLEAEGRNPPRCNRAVAKA